jgi:hypothetical protein
VVNDSRLAPHGTVGELFRDYHGELVRLAVFMVGDLPTAEDVVQDVYARLHSRPRPPDDPLPYVRAPGSPGSAAASSRAPPGSAAWRAWPSRPTAASSR